MRAVGFFESEYFVLMPDGAIKQLPLPLSADVKGYADGVHEDGFAPLKDLMTNFAEAGGKIYVCSPCFKKRGLDDGNLVPGAVIVGGAKLVEFMGEGSPSICY